MADNDEIEDTLIEQHHQQLREEVEEAGANAGLKDRFTKALSSLLTFVLCCLLYLYFIFALFVTLVVPTSITPFRNHPVHNLTAIDKNNTSGNNEALYIGLALLRNGGLLLLFLIQHSFFPLAMVTKCLSIYNMSSFIRSAYVFTTCATLQVINCYWQPILPKYHLWNCTSDSTLFYVAMIAVHSFCWVSIGFSMFVFDYLELFGIKQLYYKHLGVADPLSYKAWDNHDLLRHMRHPVFFAPLILIWAVPLMTYDRFLVGVMTPAYLIWGSQLTDEDNIYVHDMYKQKKKFLLGGKED